MKTGDDTRIIDDAERALDWHRAENDTINDGVVEALIDLAKRQQAALAPFAEEAGTYDPDEGDGDDIVWNTARRGAVRVKHLRAARDLPPANGSAPAKPATPPKIEIREDHTQPNRFVFMGDRPRPDHMGKRSWVASILINGEFGEVEQRRMVEAMAAGLETRPYRDEEFREVLRGTEKLKEERDEADRRAGAAERKHEALADMETKRDRWLEDQKRRLGYGASSVPFDAVWEAVLAKLGMQADMAQVARLPHPIRVQLALGPWEDSDGGPKFYPDPRRPFTWARIKPGPILAIEIADRPGTDRTPPQGEGWFPLYRGERSAQAGDPPETATEPPANPARPRKA